MALAQHHKPNTERSSKNCPPSTSSSRPLRPRKLSSRSRPSSATIAFLATIGLSPRVVHGHPLHPSPAEPDLPFLYPFIEHEPESYIRPRSDNLAAASSSSQAASTSSSAPASATSSNAPTAAVKVRAAGLPDQYIQGSDGLWRKTDDWSLYGAAACSVTPSSVISNDINDQVSNPNPTSMAVDPDATSSSTSLQEFDLSSLPQGWQPHDPISEGVIIAILLLSLALAIFIVFFMVSCVIWRRKRRARRKDKDKDVEKRLQKKLRGGEGDSDDDLRQAVVSQKRWARASSRWKANVRFTARRRRRDKVVVASDGPSSTTLCEDEDRYPSSISSLSRSASPISTFSLTGSRSQRQSLSEDAGMPSPPSSPRPSSSSLPPLSDTHETPRASMSATPAPPSSPLGQTIPHPPAYYRHNGEGDAFGVDAPSYPEDTPRPSSSKLLLAAHVPSTPVYDTEESPVTPTYGGHVATDDKTLLARRAAMASAPVDDDGRPSVLSLVISAPELADVSPVDFPLDALGPPSRCAPDSPGPEPAYAPPLSGLPPPSAKGKLAISHFDQYACAFERDEEIEMDIEGVEPVVGPSAPPFDAGWERPGSPVGGVVPSAPPLEMDGEEMSLGLGPSAPPEDDEDEGDPVAVDTLGVPPEGPPHPSHVVSSSSVPT
ncbi:hypothetical protein OF83DRAFT_1293203 [Amylostereum chailletii]|nr:hypothetical protein OF83DRAFT_1293203 [Amylostereum chailletii]